MAFSTICSLNFPAASTNPTTPIPTPANFPCYGTEKEGSWKKQCCVLGLTSCAIIGLEFGNFAAAADLQPTESTPVVRVQKRWSDRRACNPWRANSLETIVPENLPRPSARRRWEATGFTKADAPPVRFSREIGTKGCYTM